MNLITKAREASKLEARKLILSEDMNKLSSIPIGEGDYRIVICRDDCLDGEYTVDTVKALFAQYVFCECSFASAYIHDLATTDLTFGTCKSVYREKAYIASAFKLSETLSKLLKQTSIDTLRKSVTIPDDKLVAQYMMSIDDIYSELIGFMGISFSDEVKQITKTIREQGITLAKEIYNSIDTAVFDRDTFDSFDNLFNAIAVVESVFVSRVFTEFSKPQSDYNIAAQMYLYKTYLVKRLYADYPDTTDETIEQNIAVQYHAMYPQNAMEKELMLSDADMINEIKTLREV